MKFLRYLTSCFFQALGEAIVIVSILGALYIAFFSPMARSGLETDWFVGTQAGFPTAITISFLAAIPIIIGLLLREWAKDISKLKPTDSAPLDDKPKPIPSSPLLITGLAIGGFVVWAVIYTAAITPYEPDRVEEERQALAREGAALVGQMEDANRRHLRPDGYEVQDIRQRREDFHRRAAAWQRQHGR